MAQNGHDYSKLWELIGEIRFAMLTIRHGDGTLRARPMTTQNDDKDRGGTLWFFASRRGEPALDLQQSPDVNVSYTDTGKDAAKVRHQISSAISHRRIISGTRLYRARRAGAVTGGEGDTGDGESVGGRGPASREPASRIGRHV